MDVLDHIVVMLITLYDGTPCKFKLLMGRSEDMGQQVNSTKIATAMKSIFEIIRFNNPKYDNYLFSIDVSNIRMYHMSEYTK